MLYIQLTLSRIHPHGLWLKGWLAVALVAFWCLASPAQADQPSITKMEEERRTEQPDLFDPTTTTDNTPASRRVEQDNPFNDILDPEERQQAWEDWKNEQQQKERILLPGWAGNDVFKVVENPMFTPKQQHYFDALSDKIIGSGYYFVYVNAQLLVEERGMVILNLPQAENIPLRQEEFSKRPDGRLYWRGSSEKHHGKAKFIINHDLITGSIRIHDNYNRLYPLSGGLHLLIQEDDITHHQCGMVVKEKEGQEGDPSTDNPKQDSDGRSGVKAAECRIRLLVAYTHGADNASADIASVIEMNVDDFNEANANSSVDFSVELARSVEVTYTETNASQTDPLGNGWDTPTDLVRFWNTNDGFMDEIHSLRDLYDADMCQLLTTNLSGWGGFAMDYETNAANSFCASTWSSGGATFVHEYGHLLGLYHDPYVSSSGGYARGYIRTTAVRFRTIMAYANQCSDLGISCPRILYWSNPNVNYMGNPTGTAANNNSARRLRERDATVSGFQTAIAAKSVFQNDDITIREFGELYGLTSITTADYTVRYFSGSAGVFRAGNRITLRPGFAAYTGSVFRAHIEEACTGLNINGDDEDPIGLREDADEPELSLDQAYVIAYPNPFDDNTIIEFKLIERGMVQVEVFDISGKLVQKLIDNDELDSGVYQLHFDGSTLTAGYYNCRVITPSGNTILKLAKISGR